jgi:AraC-like DNA-binding protein
MINSQIFHPTPQLQKYIQYFIAVDILDLGDLPEIHEIFPLNLTALSFLEEEGMFRYNNQYGVSLIPASPVTIVGPMTYKGMSKFFKTGRILTIVFTAVGMYTFFNLNMCDLVDNAINGLETIHGSELNVQREKYLNANFVDEGIFIMEKYFFDLLIKKEIDLRNIDGIARLIYSLKGNVNMDWMIRQANMSVKTFERHFEEKIGLCPKIFSRIVRFSHSLKMLDQQKDVFDIIETCGYTDQAHFIKEFKKFAGNTPKLYYHGLEGIPKLFVENSVFG